MRVRVQLRRLLKDRGKSMKWLATTTGREYVTLWNFANETHGGCRYDVLESICRALDVTPGDILVLGDGKRRKPKPGSPRS